MNMLNIKHDDKHCSRAVGHFITLLIQEKKNNLFKLIINHDKRPIRTLQPAGVCMEQQTKYNKFQTNIISKSFRYIIKAYIMGVCRICYCGVLNKNSLCPSTEVEQSERSEWSVLTAWGPGALSRAPGGVQGQRPGGGPGGRGPGSSWVFRVFKTPKRLSSHSFSFIFNTSFSAKSFDIVRYKPDINDKGSFITFR